MEAAEEGEGAGMAAGARIADRSRGHRQLRRAEQLSARSRSKSVRRREFAVFGRIEGAVGMP